MILHTIYKANPPGIYSGSGILLNINLLAVAQN